MADRAIRREVADWLGCSERQLAAVAAIEGWPHPSPAAELRAFAAFVDRHGLREALRAVDGEAGNARAFARGYNGTDYARRRYHERIAAAWRDAGQGEGNEGDGS